MCQYMWRLAFKNDIFFKGWVRQSCLAPHPSWIYLEIISFFWRTNMQTSMMAKTCLSMLCTIVVQKNCTNQALYTLWVYCTGSIISKLWKIARCTFFVRTERKNIFTARFNVIKTWPWPKFHKRDHTVGLFARKITFGTHQFLHLKAPPPPTSAEEEEFSENTHWLHCIHCLAVITIIFSHGVSIYLKQETPHFLIIGDRGGTGVE